MDKETLSNYGWIVICVLVLAVMIALATPFGTYVKTGVENTATGLVETSNKGIDVAKLATGTTDEIPTGGVYTVKATNTKLLGNNGDRFPMTPQTGDTYEEGDYIYKYNQYYDYASWSTKSSQNGWGIRVKDTSKTEYGEILSEIVGQQVNTMYSTFYRCTSLTTVPTIPNSVTNMWGTFSGCTSLTTAPSIPSSVTNMFRTFTFCSSLTGTIEVNANPIDYDNCLESTQIIGITGSCSYATKNNLMSTK